MLQDIDSKIDDLIGAIDAHGFMEDGKLNEIRDLAVDASNVLDELRNPQDYKQAPSRELLMYREASEQE